VLSRTRVAALCAAVVGLASCSGGGGAIAPNPAPTSAHSSGTAKEQLVISIPHKATTAGIRRAQYVSAATQSVTVNVVPQGSATPVSGFPQTMNLTTSSPNCVSTLASTQCTLTLALSAGSYDVSLTTFDQTGGAGNVLSAAQSVPITVLSGQANTLPITLGGVPVSVQVVSAGGALTGSALSGFTLATNATANISVFGLDADGNMILGPGAPTVSLTSSAPTQVSVVAPAPGSPNTFALTSKTQTVSVTLTATVTPPALSGATAISAASVVAPPAARIFVTNAVGITVYDQNGNQQTTSGSFPNLSTPAGLGFDPVNGFLYVPNTGNSSITVYDQNGNQQTLGAAAFRNVTVPGVVAYDPANNLLYVASISNNSVTAFDQNGIQQTLSGAGFPTLNFPSDIAYDSANGFLYITSLQGGSGGNGSVAAFDQNGNPQTLSGNFPNLNQPAGIAFDPVNDFLYVANSNNNTVTVYDQNGNQQNLGASAFPATSISSPSDIVYNPVNGLFYVTNDGTDTVTAFDHNGNPQTLSAANPFPNVNGPQGIIVVP
jgi:DNA-binding beta-propeller fold protein YncE